MADVYEGGILRIWRIASGDPQTGERAIGVAFDTDLFQERRGVGWRTQDHPELTPDAHDTIEETGYRLAHGWTGEDSAPAWRTRPFVLRAFSDTGAGMGAVLFAVHRLGPARERSVGFSFAAARFALGSGDAARIHIVAIWLERRPSNRRSGAPISGERPADHRPPAREHVR